MHIYSLVSYKETCMNMVWLCYAALEFHFVLDVINADVSRLI